MFSDKYFRESACFRNCRLRLICSVTGDSTHAQSTSEALRDYIRQHSGVSTRFRRFHSPEETGLGIKNRSEIGPGFVLAGQKEHLSTCQTDRPNDHSRSRVLELTMEFFLVVDFLRLASARENTRDMNQTPKTHLGSLLAH